MWKGERKIQRRREWENKKHRNRKTVEEKGEGKGRGKAEGKLWKSTMRAWKEEVSKRK